MTKNDLINEIENVKKFSLNINLKRYKEYVDYFYSLKDDDKDYIIYYMILYKKHLTDIKNGNLDKIYNMYKILLDKLKYNKLNCKEMYIYEHVMAYLIISGNFKNNELFEKYVSTYLTKINRFNFNSRLFIIMQDIVNKLNKEYNKDCSLIFSEQDSLACTNWIIKEYKYKISLNAEKYYDSYTLKQIDDIDLLKTFSYHIFIILHEYRHLLQNEYMRNHDDNLSKIYKFELFLIIMQNKFYSKNHNSYYIEKEANNFAYDNFYKYIKNYFSDKWIDESYLKEFINEVFCVENVNNKSFILKYKLLKKTHEHLSKKNIKTKKLKIYHSAFDEKN